MRSGRGAGGAGHARGLPPDRAALLVGPALPASRGEEVRHALLPGADLALEALGAAHAAVVPVVVQVGARGAVAAAGLARRQTGGAVRLAGGRGAVAPDAEQPGAHLPAHSAVGPIRGDVRADP